MAQKKKNIHLCDYFEVNVYDPLTNDLVAQSELSYSSFEDSLLKILQLHKRFPNKDFDIFFRPNHFGGLYGKSSKE